MKNRAFFLISIGLVGSVATAVWVSRGARPAALVPAAEEATSAGPERPRAATLEVRSREELAGLRQELLKMDRDEARAWILRELEEGGDYPTRMDLRVGADQNLTDWPSYRVYLIDMLYLVDPEIAARKSRELVEISQSPDEWAVALRNVAKADGEGDATDWLQSKVAQLLRNKAWREDPSSGYLNAFDIIVHTRHTALSPELLALCDDRDQRAVRHAAFLALDRLVQASPEVLLSVLEQSAGRYSQSGLMVSNMMARADVRDPAQRAALEAYLLGPNRTVEEVNGFASVFPNANFHVSNNLLTQTPMLNGVELAERDRGALETMESWLADPRFARIQPALQGTYVRLKGFVER